MASQLGPLEVCCDAPPYFIVQACNQVGFHAPEDVRWCRLSQHRQAQAGWRNLVQFAPWNAFMTGTQLEAGPCSCGRMLPPLAVYTFTLDTGQEFSYLLTQCARCCAVYWEQA
jgi:hypothetical protein